MHFNRVTKQGTFAALLLALGLVLKKLGNNEMQRTSAIYFLYLLTS